MTLTTRLYTMFCGELVGSDAYGNRYYRRKSRAHSNNSVGDRRRHEKRWVIYKGKAEPSKVPAEWHGWLHYTLEMPLAQQAIPHYPWQKPHLPNLTGTRNAYVPPGHLLRGAQRDAATADYEPWRP